MEAVHGCFEGLQSGRGGGHSGVSSPPIYGLCVLDPALFAIARSQAELIVSLIPSSCWRSFREVRPHKRAAGGYLWLPPAKA